MAVSIRSGMKRQSGGSTDMVHLQRWKLSSKFKSEGHFATPRGGYDSLPKRIIADKLRGNDKPSSWLYIKFLSLMRARNPTICPYGNLTPPCNLSNPSLSMGTCDVGGQPEKT